MQETIVGALCVAIFCLYLKLRSVGRQVAAARESRPPLPDSPQPVIVALDFSEEAWDWFERLREKAHAASRANLVRDALRVYEWVVGCEKDGFELGVVRGNELLKVVKIVY